MCTLHTTAEAIKANAIVSAVHNVNYVMYPLSWHQGNSKSLQSTYHEGGNLSKTLHSYDIKNFGVFLILYLKYGLKTAFAC